MKKFIKIKVNDLFNLEEKKINKEYNYRKKNLKFIK